MPEYLAPDVYVEEIDTGSKPIEGVSTSTAGMIGVTERGPVGVPILVTSFGEYRRWFGESLVADLYGEHRFLPHAVEGFFTNSGRRVYVTRVLSTAAALNAEMLLFRHEQGAAAEILLTRSAATESNILFVDSPTPVSPAPAVGNSVRVGSGSDAEYRQVSVAPAATTTALVPRLPFQRTHGVVANAVERHAALPGVATSLTLQGRHAAGATSLSMLVTAGPPVVPDRIMRLDDAGAREELVYVAGAVDLGGGDVRVQLDSPLQLDHPDAEPADLLNVLPAPAAGDTTTVARAIVPGDSTLVATSIAIFGAGDFVRVAEGNRGEIRALGAVRGVRLATPLVRPIAAGTFIQHFTRADDLGGAGIRDLMEPVAAGSLVVRLQDRSGLTASRLLRIGVEGDPDVEYVRIRQLPAQVASGPDPGRVVLHTPLTRAHGGATPASLHIVCPQQDPPTAQPQSGTVVHAAAAGATDLLLTAQIAPAPTPADLIRIGSGEDALFVRIASDAALTVQQMTVGVPLLLPHAAPQPIVVREPLLEVVALDPGVWGDRLRIAARREPTPLVRSRIRNDASGIQDPTHIRLDSAAGVEPGTVLSLTDAAGVPIDAPFKVVAIDRQNGLLVTLDAAAPLPAAAGPGSAVVSMEFALGVYLLRQADPGQPSRNQQVLDSEVFRHLSLDARHSRYVHRVIGTTWVPGAAGGTDDDGTPLRRVDRRSEGASAYVRVRDLAPGLTVRIGPEFLVDVRPDGRREPARRELMGGDDQIAALTDADYVGVEDPNPELRTCLNALRNIDEISIVAAPGRIGAAMQNALIAHCETMRYRFAVLDALAPPTDALADVQNQRQQFDTKYAAIYHPWLLIPHPYAPSTETSLDYPIPPSGHVVGIYARTDVERGVHKAPANEIVRGIVGLQRLLTKGEQEILNPYPVNVNVIRDFRPDNRGIRVYGGRVITSDSDWKYVNVRRLLIFIEASIDRGLQWVVFEPNAEPLWARVRRSISNFLNLVWRNGALEGTKPEEAFFVKCDRTTMTQTDIDSGRLICVVGVAPVKPAEFVIVRIGLWTAHADE